MPEGIDIRATPVPLNEENPDQARVGALEYKAGWALTSTHKRFGGFSGLSVAPDGQLTAISDQGDWLIAHFDPASRAVISNGQLLPFVQDMPEYHKEAYDAESLIRHEGRFLVAFEQKHRILQATPGGPVSVWPPSTLMDFTAVADNAGMEAISWTKEGLLMALPERGVDTDGRLRGWLVGADSVDHFHFIPPDNFSPTDAALLPNGDILLLLRFFSLTEGVATKIMRLRADELRPGSTLVGEELAHLAPPITVDNMEGLDVGEGPAGETFVFVMSDDNFSASQRTLLLVFELLD